jgi:Cadherin-like beta sandwich domain/Putative Ig domain/Secretion system C-terminal sorting domain
MKKLLLTCMIWLTAIALWAKMPEANGGVYVKATATGDGIGWGNAAAHSQAAIDFKGVSPDSFTHKISDGSLTSNIATVTVMAINRVEAQITNATTVNYTVTFSEPVSGVDASDFTLTTSGVTGSIGTPTGSGATWTVPINSIVGNGTLRLDFTGTTGVTPNVSAAYTTGEVYTFDHLAPTLVSGSYFSNNGYSSQYAKVGNMITLSVGFNEALQAITIAIAGHPVTAVASNGNKNWTATYSLVTGDTEGNIPWTYSATDLAGNVRQQSNTDFGTVLIFDKTPPVINITPTAVTAAPGTDASFTIAYVDPNFSYSSLSSGDITVNTTGTAAYTSLILSGSGSTYTAKLTGVSGWGTLGISVAASTAQDIPGNIAGASSPSATILIASNNADLSALGTTAAGLSPTFDPATAVYTASVPYATTSTTITPTKAHAGATIKVRVNGNAYTTLTSGSSSGALVLDVGANVIEILVTAENEITTKTYTLTVTRVNEAPTIEIFPAVLLDGAVGSFYSQTITASGGTSPYTYKVTAGLLPDGLTLSNTGTLSGTPTAGGISTFTVTATDASTSPGPYSASRNYSINTEQVLPITLINYSVKKDANYAKIVWSTASENNNQRFEILKSTDGITFLTIGSIKGNGTTSISNNYSFYDRNPFHGASYYKLMQIDNNGKVNDLGTRSLNFDLKEKAQVLISPNPAQDFIKVKFNDPFTRIEILDMNGKILKTLSVSSEDDEAIIDISYLKPNNYLLRLSNSSMTVVKKMIKL